MLPEKKDSKASVLAKWKSLKNKSANQNLIIARPEDAVVSPSSGQYRLWLLQQLYPDSPFYQYGHLYKIKGELDIDILTQSFQYLIDRHEILRSNFKETTDGVKLISNPSPTFSIQILDAEDIKGDTEKAHQLAKKEVSETFDLSNDLLLRISIIPFSATENWMVLSIHHIIGDRASLLLMNEEVFSYYQKLSKGEEVIIEPLSVQYADYAYWKNAQKTNEKQLNYWLKQLERELPLLSLPTDHQRPRTSSFKGETISKKLSVDISSKINQLAKANDTTLYVVILAAFKLLLYRYTQQEDILIGSPFGNRDKVELEKLVGFFNETLVIRSKLSDEKTFTTYIQEIKVTTMHALENKNIPFDRLVQELQPTRQSSSNPLFQAMFVYNNASNSTSKGMDIEIEDMPIDLGVSKFDLTLFANNQLEYLELALEFSLDLFEVDTIERMLNHLEVILTSVSKRPEQAVSKVALLTPNERQQILVEWNDTQTDLPSYSNIHSLIQEVTKTHSQQIAVRCEGKEITYQELEQRANYVAALLLEKGVQANTAIGLYTPRSLEMMVGILGILKAGAAYLPLDPAYPKERIEYMIDDADVSIVLTMTALEKQISSDDITVIDIESIDYFTNQSSTLPSVDGQDLAYFIYTSGSTGKPKGVPISHDNLIHSTTARFEYFRQQPKAFLLLSSFSFDSSIVGIFWTLCSGGTLVLPKNRIEQDIQALSKVIHKNQISHTLLLPSLYALLLELAPINQLKSLNTVMVAGEACLPNVIRDHYQKVPQAELINEYGPTEGTVWCTAHKILPKDALGLVPIGRPIPNVQHYILDKNLEPVPVGIAGELYIAGNGITRGYWQRPELTDERFLAHPFKGDAGKIYRTGDLVRYRKDGLIDFLGRVDRQVKIRGHRIEPDEIKKVLLTINTIQMAELVIKTEGNLSRLIAYIKYNTQGEKQDIKSILKDKLPDYMIPSALVKLEEFPTLPNGKIDFSNLPEPQKADFSNEKEFVDASSEIELQLAKIWEEVLKINPIGIHDNFFEIGGDSMRSIQVIAKAQNANIALAPHQLFEYQTIAELARFLERKDEKQDEWSSLVSLNKTGTKPPLFCIHSGGAHVFFYHPLAQHLGNKQPLYALQPVGLDGKEQFHSTINEMASYYIQEMKKVQPIGPYHLLGTCFSNAVGLEMAHQLKNNGEEIAMLLFVDSGPAYLEGAVARGEKKTASRFAKMVKNGDWKGISKKLRNRWIRTQQKVLAPLENEQEKNLRLTIQSLNHLYNYYDWMPIDERITFIRSSEFAGRIDKDGHISQWTKLAQGGLDIHVVSGHHLTLFAEPEVGELANKIKECIHAI